MSAAEDFQRMLVMVVQELDVVAERVVAARTTSTECRDALGCAGVPDVAAAFGLQSAALDRLEEVHVGVLEAQEQIRAQLSRLRDAESPSWTTVSRNTAGVDGGTGGLGPS